MKRVARGVGRAFEALDALELVFYIVMGAAVMLLGAYLGVRAAFERGGVPVALALGVIGLVAALTLIRDLIERRWSPVSIGFTVLWVLATLYMIVTEGQLPWRAV